MKRALFVLALAVALTFTFTAAAFADHSPSFYIKWNRNGGYAGANAAVPSPHAGYAEGTQKCAVCHAAHRAPVGGTSWIDQVYNVGDPNVTTYSAEITSPAGSEGFDNGMIRSTYSVPAGTNTQMLLQSDVAGACDYCHILTSVGGEQIYAGAIRYRVEAEPPTGSDWETGFAHNNTCTGCHAVHGASTYGTFKGAAQAKVLKVRAKGTSTNWMNEITMVGTSYSAGELAVAFPVNTPVATDAVDPLNMPLFPSIADATNGSNVRADVPSAYDAQVTAFCTSCHANYSYASEATINLNSAQVALFQQPWVFNGVNVRQSASATNPVGLGGKIPFKNHPMKVAETTLTAAGKSSTVVKAAWKNANTCRDCHDAGVKDFAGVIVQSFPHFTPGYWKFMKSGANSAATTSTYDNTSIAATLAAGDALGLGAVQSWLDLASSKNNALKTADGHCLKCHVNNATTGVGLNF